MSEKEVVEPELIKRKKMPTKKIWHTQQEEILKRWSEIGSSYRFMHDRAFTSYEKKNLRFALPVIIISTITGTANFAQNSFPDSWKTYVPLGIGFLNLAAGLMTTVAQFLRVSELLEGHRAAAIAYSKFSRNISVELSLPREDRSCGGTEFVNNCRSELDRLIEQSPNIPLAIIRRFGKKFSENGFTKPDILTISQVSIFKDEQKEKMEANIEAMKHAEEMRRELMNTEKIRRHTIMEEFTQKKALESDLIEEKKRKSNLVKKEAVSLGSVTNNMSKLLEKLTNADKNSTVITPESSDAGENEDRSIILTIGETSTDNINTIINDDEKI